MHWLLRELEGFHLFLRANFNVKNALLATHPSLIAGQGFSFRSVDRGWHADVDQIAVGCAFGLVFALWAVATAIAVARLRAANARYRHALGLSLSVLQARTIASDDLRNTAKLSGDDEMTDLLRALNDTNLQRREVVSNAYGAVRNLAQGVMRLGLVPDIERMSALVQEISAASRELATGAAQITLSMQQPAVPP